MHWLAAFNLAADSRLRTPATARPAAVIAVAKFLVANVPASATGEGEASVAQQHGNGLGSMGLVGLFLSALLSATLLPGQSELVLSGMILAGRWELATLVAVATIGNVLGSTVNWALGRFLAHRRDAKWFPFSAEALVRAEQRFQRYGWPLLLLSWVPIIGDPLTLIAGALRMKLLPFLCIVTLAKGGRYVILTAALIGVASG
jgi:membrane protein YqaA with SNARE-associated domain